MTEHYFVGHYNLNLALVITTCLNFDLYPQCMDLVSIFLVYTAFRIRSRMERKNYDYLLYNFARGHRA